MNAITTFIENRSRIRSNVIASLIFFSIPCALYLYVSSLSSTFSALWPLDMYFGLPCEKTYNILHEYGTYGRNIFKWCEIIEIFFYIPSYAVCMSIVSCALFRRAKIFYKFYIILLAAFLLDMLETSCLLYLVMSYNNSYRACGFVKFVSLINMIKWIVGGSWIALVLIALLKVITETLTNTRTIKR
jgi:hypothetical protein